MKKYLKEPLLHFLLLGAALFLLNGWVSDEEAASDRYHIEITKADLDRITSNWEMLTGVPPDQAEQQKLVKNFIREEIYYREAQSLQLDESDPIIRKRMVQKMDFLQKDLAEMTAPTEAELKDYFDENKEAYREPSLVSFRQIYFNSDMENAGKLAKATAEKLRAKELTAAEAANQFHSPLFATEYLRQTQSEVKRVFGNEFSQQLFELPTAEWSAPVKSGFGWHVILVNEFSKGEVPAFADVFPKVKEDYLYERRNAENEKMYARLEANYTIVFSDSVKNLIKR